MKYIINNNAIMQVTLVKYYPIYEINNLGTIRANLSILIILTYYRQFFCGIVSKLKNSRTFPPFFLNLCRNMPLWKTFALLHRHFHLCANLADINFPPHLFWNGRHLHFCTPRVHLSHPLILVLLSSMKMHKKILLFYIISALS